jgi:hypothetical protein
MRATQHSELRSRVGIHPRTVLLCQQSVRLLGSDSDFSLAAHLVPHVHSETSLHRLERRFAPRLVKQQSPGLVGYRVEDGGW